MKWIVEDVPTWLVGVVLIVGIPALAVGVKYTLHHKTRWLSSNDHNDVAGFQVAIVAVVYAIIVGFTIVSLYENAVTARDDVSTEAADLLQVHVGDSVLGTTTAARVDADVVAYAHAIVNHWTQISEGNTDAQVQASLNDIYVALDAYHPRTAAESDYLLSTVTDLDQLSQASVTRTLEAQEAGSLPLVLWIVILLTSAVTLGFALLFSLENLKLAYLMVLGVAAVLAVNLFVLVELGYPFIGSVAVGPGKFLDVIHLVTG